jgi:methyltransferase (TIGR00027 family)
MNPISRTAFYCCGVRMDDAKRKEPVCNDIYSKRFMNDNGMRIYEPFRAEKMPNISNIVRCRIIDDLISSNLNTFDNVNIVTIGAGFDSRPYRISGGNWIELDEPKIIEYKNKCLPIEECSNPLQRIRIEFNRETLASKLQNVDKSSHTIIVIEGVFMYLKKEEIEETLIQLQQIFPKHILCCELMTRAFFEKFAQSVHAKLSALGGRFAESHENPEAIFMSHGYELIERIPVFKRASDLGLLWKEARIPKFMAKLLLDFLMKDLGGYSVYLFSFG